MKVLVVGGGGFLGSEIVKDLVENGHDVKSLGRHISHTIKCEQIVADLASPDSYENELSTWQPEVVIQSAWITSQKIYRMSPLNSEYVGATLKFAEKCFQSETQHFLVLGSSAEYGVPTEPCNARSTPVVPVDLYGISKLRTLESLGEIAGEYSRRLSWARIFQPYGRNQDLARLIPQAVGELRVGKSVKVGNPNTILDWISSRDVASALTYALKNPLDTVFDIGTSKGNSVIQVLQSLAILLDADLQLIEGVTNPLSASKQFTMVVSKTSPLLEAGWRPQDDLNSGLQWTLSL